MNTRHRSILKALIAAIVASQSAIVYANDASAPQHGVGIDLKRSLITITSDNGAPLPTIEQVQTAMDAYVQSASDSGADGTPVAVRVSLASGIRRRHLRSGVLSFEITVGSPCGFCYDGPTDWRRQLQNDDDDVPEVPLAFDENRLVEFASTVVNSALPAPTPEIQAIADAANAEVVFEDLLDLNYHLADKVSHYVKAEADAREALDALQRIGDTEQAQLEQAKIDDAKAQGDLYKQKLLVVEASLEQARTKLSDLHVDLSDEAKTTMDAARIKNKETVESRI